MSDLPGSEKRAKSKKRNTAGLSVFESDMVTPSDVGDFTIVDVPVEFRTPRKSSYSESNTNSLLRLRASAFRRVVLNLFVHSWDVYRLQGYVHREIEHKVPSELTDSEAFIQSAYFFGFALDLLDCPKDQPDFEHTYWEQFIGLMEKNRLGTPQDVAEKFLNQLIQDRTKHGWDSYPDKDRNLHLDFNEVNKIKAPVTDPVNEKPKDRSGAGRARKMSGLNLRMKDWKKGNHK